MSAVPKPVELPDEERPAARAVVGVPHDFPDDLKDIVYTYLRIDSAELKAAAVRAVRAIAQS